MRIQEASMNQQVTSYYMCIYVYLHIHLRYLQSKYPYFIIAIILVHNSNNDNNVSILMGSVLGLTQQIVISLIFHAPG